MGFSRQRQRPPAALREYIYDLTSSAPVLGSTSALFWGAWPLTESNPAINTMTSFAGDFHVYAQDGGSWQYSSRGFAQSNYLFTPQTDQLQIQFTGLVEMHAFDNWANFSLVDTVANSIVDSQKWSTEWPPFLNIDRTGNYAVTPGREYNLTLYAQYSVGDATSGGRTELFATIIPEPTTLLLLGLGALRNLKRFPRL
jgi:hypothetical protein